MAQTCATHAEVEVEPWVLPVGAGVGWAGADAAIGEAGRWGCAGTPPGILGECY
jgi:hypothetical protein